MITWVAAAHLLACVAAVAIGIDLGTTNSAVACIASNLPCIIPNALGNPTTPSVVAFTSEGVLVGEMALQQASSNVQNTLHSVKRFLGRSLADVSRDASSMGFKVVDFESSDVAFICPARPQPLAAEEVNAAIVAQLVADAERHLGVEIRAAVITVPAYYNDRQRAATRAAAQLAGVVDVELLSEPVAACLAYGVSGETGRVLVFDLGAGTFDVSVLSITATGDIEVIATSGDAHLGGDDFDSVLVDWLANQADALGHSLHSNKTAMRQIREAAEAAKKQLSVLKCVMVSLPCATNGAALELELSRAQLETICEPLLRRLKTPLYEVALTAGVSLPGEQEMKGFKKKPTRRRRARMDRPIGSQNPLPIGAPVDQIVMVGGASKMVAVRKLVSNLFGVDPRRTVDPMQAVALGAAVQAGILNGEVRHMRVLQTWQADVGRILGRMRGQPSSGSDVPASCWLDEHDFPD